ncbi:MAG TPA: hypothetical protein VF466_00935 [Candidatus Saccharimonadales bacterium]
MILDHDRLPPVSCAAYPFANDRWNMGTVASLRLRLEAQRTPIEQATALVIGSGGLPYLFGHAEVSAVCSADASDGVIKMNRWRVATLQDHDAWDAYHMAVGQCLGYSDNQRYEIEREIASNSTLQRHYGLTRERAAAAELRGYPGDIRRTAAHIGQAVADEGRAFTLVNVTNVASYAGTMGETGRQVMSRIVCDLPLAPDAVIVDSSHTYAASGGLVPRLYTQAEYAQYRL